MASVNYIYALVCLVFSPALLRTQAVNISTISSSQEEQIIKKLEDLADKDHLGSIIWNITNKYSIFRANNTVEECLEEIDTDHSLVSPYLVNITLNESQIFMENYFLEETKYVRGNELKHAHNLYEKHNKIIHDQEEYLSASRQVLEKLQSSLNKSLLCPPSFNCGCIQIEILEKYELQLSLFRQKNYSLWEYIIFATYIDPVFRAFMILIGLLLNGTIIYMFKKEESIRRESNIMVFNLVVINFIMLLVYIPMHYVYKYHLSVLPGRLGFYMIQIVVISAYATTVLMLNIQKYVDVSRVLSPSVGGLKLESRGRSIVYVATVWIWSLLITILLRIADPPSLLILEFTLYFLVYLLIFAIIHAVMSALTSRKLQHAAERGQISTELQQVTSSSVVVSQIIAFYVIYLPFFFFLPFNRSEGERDVQYFFPTSIRVVDLLFHQLLFAYPSVNAIVLYKASNEFRRYYQKYLCCCWYKGDDGQYLTMSSLQQGDNQE